MEILQDKSQIKRVFYHELGHYFAFRIGNIHILDFKIDEISIYPCQNAENFLCGKTKPVIPKEIKVPHKIPLERVPHFLINQMYGAIFQIVFANPHLELIECIKFFGKDDYSNFNVQIQQNNLRNKKDEIINLFKNHLEMIKSKNNTEIEKLIENTTLFVEDQNSIQVNIQNLDKVTESSFVDLTKMYNDLLNDLESIIKEK